MTDNDAVAADAGAEVAYTSHAAGVRASSVRYDNAVKRLLSERQVIARILAATLREFKGAGGADLPRSRGAAAVEQHAS